MKIACISDLHGTLPTVPSCDLLIIAGDICPVWNHDLMFQAQWLDTNFRSWLEKVPAKQVVGIAGNHDWIFQEAPDYVPFGLPWTYLQDSGCNIGGLTLWGSPWQPRFNDWAFNADPDQLKEIWAKIPYNTDILVTHGPPYGVFDMVDTVRHCGCPHLLAQVDIIRPRAHIFGHIHSNTGKATIGGITFVNAAILDDRYRHVAEPVVLDLAAKERAA